MKDIKKKRVITISIIACVVVLALLGIAYIITKSFVLNAALHIYIDLLMVPVILAIIHKCLKDQLSQIWRKVLGWCGVFIVIDTVIVEAVRYILSHGGLTVLFLPACVPLCFMVIMLYSAKDSGRDKRTEALYAWIIGVPLLLISLYFEIISFMLI